MIVCKSILSQRMFALSVVGVYFLSSVFVLISLSKDNYTLNVTRNDVAIHKRVISTFSMKYVSKAAENLGAPFLLKNDLQQIKLPFGSCGQYSPKTLLKSWLIGS